jgi:hypothetical protein
MHAGIPSPIYASTLHREYRRDRHRRHRKCCSSDQRIEVPMQPQEPVINDPDLPATTPQTEIINDPDLPPGTLVDRSPA